MTGFLGLGALRGRLQAFALRDKSALELSGKILYQLSVSIAQRCSQSEAFTLGVGLCPGRAFPLAGGGSSCCVMAQVLTTTALSELLHLSELQVFTGVIWNLEKLSSGFCCEDHVRSCLSKCSMQVKYQMTLLVLCQQPIVPVRM